jgi:hypothetical protein
VTIKFPDLAKELGELLDADQTAIKQFSSNGLSEDDVRAQIEARTARALEILHQIRLPSLSNVGDKGALAFSVLATHGGVQALRIVLGKFEELYATDPENCRYQSIPAMTDALRIAERKPEKFGTQWFFDKDGWPFLPVVEDFEHINERRNKYGIEPLRWPKSLVLPENEQPWLSKPITEAVMRTPTEEEYNRNLG